MKKNILIIALVVFIAPLIAFASWWNPFSWFNNWSFKKLETNSQIQTQVKIQENSENEINESQKQTEELKKQQSIAEIKTLEKPKTENIKKDNIFTSIQSPNSIQSEEKPKTEASIKKEEIAVKNNSVNYDSIIDFSSISSDDLSEYISLASNKTGVPSDLLLYVLKNNKLPQSTCYIKDSKIATLSNGKDINKADLTAFNNIIYNLKANSSETALSCDGTIGFGFIPRTWIMISQLGDNLDNSNKLLNPWKPEDVIMEIALWLGSNGGSFKGNLLTGEFNQALACKNTTWCK